MIEGSIVEMKLNGNGPCSFGVLVKIFGVNPITTLLLSPSGELVVMRFNAITRVVAPFMAIGKKDPLSSKSKCPYCGKKEWWTAHFGAKEHWKLVCLSCGHYALIG